MINKPSLPWKHIPWVRPPAACVVFLQQSLGHPWRRRPSCTWYRDTPAATWRTPWPFVWHRIRTFCRQCSASTSSSYLGALTVYSLSISMHCHRVSHTFVLLERVLIRPGSFALSLRIVRWYQSLNFTVKSCYKVNWIINMITYTEWQTGRELHPGQPGWFDQRWTFWFEWSKLGTCRVGHDLEVWSRLRVLSACEVFRHLATLTC